MIVAEAAYEPTDPTVDSQIVRLKSAGADVFYNISAAEICCTGDPENSRARLEAGPYYDSHSTSVGGVLKPAGLDLSRGIISVNWGKDPGDPTWDNDPGMKKWRAFMDKYYPEGDKNSSFNTYGYGIAQTLEEVLRACGDNLTRENVMKQFTSMKDVELDLLLPGIVMNTSPT